MNLINTMLRGKKEDTHTTLKKQRETSYCLGSAYIDGSDHKERQERGEGWGYVSREAQKSMLGCGNLGCLLNNYSLNSRFVFYAISVCIAHNLKMRGEGIGIG